MASGWRALRSSRLALALRGLVLSLALATPFGAARAGEAAPSLVPGRMGFNALPPLPGADPAIPDRVELELSAAGQSDGRAGGDTAATPYVRAVVPLRGIAALELDGTPLEVWRTSRSTQRRNGADHRGGVSPGDLRFGGRFLLREEDARGPALGVRFVVKSTTGKQQASRRFTNAPAYAIEGLLGRDLVDGPVRLRAVARLGFLAWQMGANRQDDAVDYGATLRVSRERRWALELEWRGYLGWRGQDRPSVLQLATEVPLSRAVALRAALARGLTSDSPRYDARLGLVFRFDPLH